MSRLFRGVALLLGAGLALAACSEAEPRATARRVATRTELVGGPSALGEIGDFLLENDKIRVVIQDKGFSRGFGVYGGSLIDADRVRPVSEGGPEGGNGRDQFGELFPVFFLQALEPSDEVDADGKVLTPAVQVVADGTDGEAAAVRVRGHAADFLTMTKALNRAILNSHELPRNPLELLEPDSLPETEYFTYDVTYALAPGERVVKITTRLANTTDQELTIPSALGKTLLGVLRVETDNFKVPLGFVLLFGAGNDIFAPGYGYDIRFALEESFKAGLPFPTLAGLLVPGLVGTTDRGVSYGFFTVPDPAVRAFANHRTDADGKNLYEEAYGVDVDEGTLLLPFTASSFTGAFYPEAPEKLAPKGEAGDSFAFTTYFVVGDGDAASVLDEMWAMRGIATGELRGEVRDAMSTGLLAGASVIVYDEKDRPFNQFRADAAGRIAGRLPPGKYTARVQHHPGQSEPVAFSIDAGEATFLTLGAPTAGRIAVQVGDETGRKLPAKITVVGTVAAADAGKPLRKFLFDLAAGEHWRTDDQVPDRADDASTRRYIEAIEYTHDGHAVVEVRPGVEYEVFVSRGPEYTVQRVTAAPAAGETAHVAALLRRVVDTSGYVAADFHVHAQPSLDSEVPLERRVISGAAEGLEYLVATDHNFITDYQPTIERLGLESWVASMIGIELTTLESGHFNGFPMKREVGEITKGSFEWSLKPPQAIFDAIRAHGAFGPDETVVQVNHARDGIMGYFDQYDLDPLTAEIPEKAGGGFDFARVIDPSGPAFTDAEGASTFSLDFDALEVFNSSIPPRTQMHHGRVPTRLGGLPAEVREKLPPAGTMLCDEDDELAFPGVIDDWFNLLNKGLRVTALGNSDSHHDDDIGSARTWVRLGDDPARLEPLAVARAVRAHRAILSNGPFLELFAGGAEVGDDVKASGGAVDVRVRVRAAPWIDVRRGTLFANGEILERFEVKLEDGEFQWEKRLDLPQDTWLVAEVEGDRSMFPVLKPIDVAPFLLNDAFATLAGPLGLGAGELAPLDPPRTGFFTPFAITNPIWVDADGGGYDQPAPPTRRCRNYGVEVVEVPTETREQGLQANPRQSELISRERFVPSFGFPRIKGDVRDVRVIFEHFGHHGH